MSTLLAKSILSLIFSEKLHYYIIVEHSYLLSQLFKMDFKPNFYDYSMKNIPIPTKRTYMNCFIEKVESFIRRMRWKAYFFNNNNKNESEIEENFGFPSIRCPPIDEHLTSFEQALYQIIQEIEFKDPSTTAS